MFSENSFHRVLTRANVSAREWIEPWSCLDGVSSIATTVIFATTAISYILPSLLMILMAILLRTTRWTQVCIANLQGFWREKNPCCSLGRKAEPVLQAGDRPLRVVHRHQVASGDLLLHRPDPHQPAVRHRQQAPWWTRSAPTHLLRKNKTFFWKQSQRKSLKQDIYFS